MVDADEEQFDPEAFQTQLDASLGVVDQLVRSWLPPEQNTRSSLSSTENRRLVGRLPG
jgi:hypothetical protein